METVLKRIPDEVMFEERTIAFRAILLYEHQEGAEAAKAVLDRVRARLPETETTEISPWRFDRLGDPRAAQWARAHGTDADLIVIAAKGGEPLPSEIKQTLENWALENVAVRYGFVVLLTDISEAQKTESPVYHYMENLSGRTECDFFARGLRSEWEQTRYVTDARIEAELADQEFMAMSGPTRRWGIND